MPRTFRASELRVIGTCFDLFRYDGSTGIAAAARYFSTTRQTLSAWVNGRSVPRRALRLKAFHYMQDEMPDLAKRLRTVGTTATCLEMTDAAAVDFKRIPDADLEKPPWMRKGPKEGVA